MLPVVKSMVTPAFIPSLGLPELAVILFIVLVIFGPKKLPEMGKAIGQSIRELKKATEAKDEEKQEDSTVAK
ncbi:MAG TPA: twin-arginine translocase TatA/TatE family subunit [Anaerolineae bacterium]|nr:twin-arginine translocase TatA/TatE family subunit [Anaerolineae bacterium]